MAIKEFDNTPLSQRISTTLYTGSNYDLAPEHTGKIVDIAVTGSVTCLSDIKSKDMPVAFEYKESNGVFIMALVVQYVGNKDDKKMPGHWDISGTFNESDMPENTRKVNAYMTELFNYFRAIGGKKYSMGFELSEYMADVFKTTFSVIKQWLDENATETEVVGVSMENVITFKVAVEDGKKVFSIELAPEIKQLIKDDSELES